VAEAAAHALRGAALATRSRRLRVVHVIRAHFERPVMGAELLVRLAPRPLPSLRIEHHQLVVQPRPARAEAEEEPDIARERIAIREAFRTLEIMAVSTIARTDPAESLSPASRDAALSMLERTGVRRLAASSTRGPGACRAAAETALALLREAGVEARYAAGYPVPVHGTRSLPHAWVSVMIPGEGWVDFDPTCDTLAPDHVLLGRGAGYDDVAPLSGSLFGSGGYRLSSEVTVEALQTA
jgi:hypothetical protein